jgi:DNA-binding MarR family transcriptional regulator
MAQVKLVPDGVAPSQPQTTAKKQFSPKLAWSPALAQTRYVAVVHGFLDHYASLKPYSLTPGEAMFVVHLMRYKWGEEAPFPGYKTIARQMGVSDKMVRRYAKSLEQKGFLRREIRRADTNRFDLEPLFRALEQRMDELGAKRAARLKAAA